MKTTAGQLLINAALPKELRDYKRILNKKNIKEVLQYIAKKYPTEYKNIMEKLKEIGQRSAYLKGSYLSLNDFRSPINHKGLIEKRLSKIPINSSDDIITKHFSALQKEIEKKTFEAAKAKKNSLAMQVEAGARGNLSQLASTISSPVMYADHKGKPIRIPIFNSYSNGLDPVEFFAASYGTRRGVISTKFATPEGGFYAKQIGYVAGNMLVTSKDCGTDNGIEQNTEDSENIGRLLAKQTDGFKKNTIITPEIISTLLKKRIKKIIIRSPITCEEENGVCQFCRGYTEIGTFPALGTNVGSDSASALSESATQAAKKEKHTGGVIGAKKIGLEAIKQLLKVPKIFSGGAVVSEVDGKIKNIEKAPQGGFNIDVENKENKELVRHYILPDYNLLIKKGQTIEAGMPLSTGIINPADVTRLRGIGEGRKFLFESLRKAYIDSGQKVNKVHMETLSRSMLNLAKVADNTFLDDNVPGDIVNIHHVQKYYKPKVILSDTNKAEGKYLSKQYMHLIAGTRLKPSMLKLLSSHGIKKIEVTDEPPPFDPVMIRLDDVPAYKESWLGRLFSSHIKQRILGATSQSESTSIHGTDFVPAYVYGKEFGKQEIGY